VNGTLLTPAWPRTVNRPTTRQTGETCLTVKTTREASRSRKVRVVRRRALGPWAAIQGRELCRRAIEVSPPVRDDEDRCEADPDPDPEAEPPAARDLLDATPAIGEVDVATPGDGAVACVEGMEGVEGTDGVDGADGGVGAGRAGRGGAGRVGTGTGRGGGVTTGGGGRTSADADPAPTHTAAIPAAAAVHRMTVRTSIV
jgi:hypothetical protein